MVPRIQPLPASGRGGNMISALFNSGNSGRKIAILGQPWRSCLALLPIAISLSLFHAISILQVFYLHISKVTSWQF